MKCPHCQIDFHDNVQSNFIDQDVDGLWSLDVRKCPACHRLVLELAAHEPIKIASATVPGEEKVRYLVRPKVAGRPRPPSAVPPQIADDYIQASAVISDSPMASAALSRRCLQQYESPRFLRRLNTLRGWSHEEDEQVLA
jgi:hypothetical protein